MPTDSWQTTVSGAGEASSSLCPAKGLRDLLAHPQVGGAAGVAGGVSIEAELFALAATCGTTFIDRGSL